MADIGGQTCPNLLLPLWLVTGFALILVLENQLGCPTNFKPNWYLSELHLNQFVLYQNQLGLYRKELGNS